MFACAAAQAAAYLPGLAKRPDLHAEGPGAPILMSDVPDFFGPVGDVLASTNKETPPKPESKTFHYREGVLIRS